MTCLGLPSGASDRRRGLVWGAAVVLAGLAWSQPAGVRAQEEEASRFSVSVDGEAIPTCQLIDRPCETDGTCEAGEACLFLPGDTLTRHCTRADGASRDIYCCDPDLGTTACAPTGGVCTPVTSDISVCVDPADPRELCHERWGDGALTACFLDAVSGEATRDWRVGDCDGDGIKNASEHDGCVCDDDESCGVEPDAGVPDAGSSAADGGGTNVDAGEDDDRDSGSPPIREDAGGSDSGSEEVSADPGRYDFRGSGGCTCQSTDAGSTATWFLLGLAILMGRALRRRTSR